ncbi:MAG: hypothetical protein ACSHYF_01655 [Verrucomicrobiaceae bacterium]
MNDIATTYMLYLAIAVPVTVWVGKTLHRSGRIFLVDCFHGNTEMADSVNHLLLVGFYLINIGFVTLYMQLDFRVIGVTGIFEALSRKIGVVLLVLGVMHFINIVIFNKIRKQPVQTPPPLGKF